LVPSRICSNSPTQPEAITGIFTFDDISFNIPKSYPDFVPSFSIEVSNISPAPSFSTFSAQEIASIQVASLPPFTNTSYLPCTFFTSIATTKD
jgi:hypothetical protein